MTREETIFCEKSYIGETNCKDCKYYGLNTCKSRESHRMAIKALEQQPCEDCVSRKDAIETAIEAVDDWDGGYNLSRADIIEKAIKSLPSVYPKVKTGYWECNELFGDGEIQFANIRCSECGNEMIISPYRYNRLHELEKYCSICGCKMEG